MNLIRTVLFASALAATATGVAQAKSYPGKIPALYSNVYVPVGFDSNDHVQIVGEGMFDNACYRPAETTAKVDVEKKRITLTPAAYEYKGLCAQIILPFERVINIGIVPAGDYEIYQVGDTKKLGVLPVKKAKSESPDDFLYAPISQAFVDEKDNKSELILRGEFPTDCMAIDEIKVIWQDEVIVIQPIATLQERENCALGYYPWTKRLPIAASKVGRYLLHVRSMNSKAINNLVNVK